jgi:hypothetical protein
MRVGWRVVHSGASAVEAFLDYDHRLYRSAAEYSFSYVACARHEVTTKEVALNR